MGKYILYNPHSELSISEFPDGTWLKPIDETSSIRVYVFNKRLQLVYNPNFLGQGTSFFYYIDGEYYKITRGQFKKELDVMNSPLYKTIYTEND